MAHEPFSVRVASPQWRATALAWIERSLAEQGIVITGEPDQLRIRPWSTQITVPTDHGTVWFKATCPSMAFEPAVQDVIARLVPDAVRRPLAIEPEQGWMLTPDHGSTVGDSRTPTVADWRRAVAEAARVQRRLAGHREELLAAGLPDAAPSTVLGRFDRLLDLYAGEGGVARIPDEVAQHLRARRPELADACALLDASPVPSTWQHGDLHPYNLHEADGAIAFFDLGDGMWSHAIEILAVPHGIVTGSSDLDWDEVVTAWTEVWEVEPDHFAELWRASGFTHAGNRALTWHGALLTATADEVAQWGDAVEHHLSSMLDA